MPLEPLFRAFLPSIQESFAKAKRDGGLKAEEITLVIEEEPLGKGRARAEFNVMNPAGPVRITWNGVGSLWAFSQGAVRLSSRMFEEKRRGGESLLIDSDPELRRGLDSLVMAERLCSNDIPVEKASLKDWPSWAPPIEASPTAHDDIRGNWFFLAALGWIFRHEIAHVALSHSQRQTSDGLTDQQCEAEADIEATRWLRASYVVDPTRKAGSHPDPTEIELERRALWVGLGLIWVALFEADRGRTSEKHPPVADRLFACLEELQLKEDSFATEVLSDVIQVWLSPEKGWGISKEFDTSRGAMDEAIFQLHRRLIGN